MFSKSKAKVRDKGMKELQTEAWPSDFIKASTGEKLLALGQYG